jgi:hypothetical protein
LCRRTIFPAREGVSNFEDSKGFPGSTRREPQVKLQLELIYGIEMLLTYGRLSKGAGQTIIDEARRYTTGNKDIS